MSNQLNYFVMRKCTIITVLSVLFLILTASVTGEPRHLKDDRERLKEAPIDNNHGGGDCEYSCSVTTYCYNILGKKVGEVSCTGSKCKRGSDWVKCDGNKTCC